MPRIYDNGTYRDMTAEEIEQYENQSSGGAELLEEGWRLIQDITLTEDISSFIVDSIQCKEIKIVYKNKTGSDVAGWIQMTINDNGEKGKPNTTVKNNAVFIFEASLYDNLILKSFLNNVVDYWVNGFSCKRDFYYEYLSDEYINKITFGSGGLLKTGCTIKVYVK